jgi:phycocyanobilin lyase alpha subunit
MFSLIPNEFMLEDFIENNSGVPAGTLNKEKALANLAQKEDLGLRYYAAWWLGKFRIKETEAVDALLLALQDEEDRAPDGGYPLRRNAAKALGKLDDLRAVPAIIECLACDDYYVRESAAQALEKLGDRTAISHLTPFLAGGVAAAVRVTGKPHLIEPYEAIIEALGSLGAIEAIELIEPFLEHSTEKVRYAAARAMYQLTEKDIYGELLVRALEGDDLQLRRSALMDLGAIGYVPAGEAIASTLAENSLKLISLKGLLEKELDRPFDSLSAASLRIMDLMDSLL